MNEPKTSPSAVKPTKTSKKQLLKYIGVGLVSFMVGAALVNAIYPNVHSYKTINTDNSATNLVGSSDYSDVEACDILRQKDVEVVLGGTVYKEQAGMIDNDPNSPPVPTVCIYSADSDPKNGITRLNLNHYRGEIDRAKLAYESQKIYSLTNASGVEVNDLGDGAFWTPEGATLTVRKGDTVFMLVLGDPDLAGRTLDRTKDLAQKVLNRY